MSVASALALVKSIPGYEYLADQKAFANAVRRVRSAEREHFISSRIENLEDRKALFTIRMVVVGRDGLVAAII